MIVLHSLKLIFVKPRKVAGTSLEIALSKFAGPDDIVTPIIAEDEKVRSALGYRRPQNDYVPFCAYRLGDWGRLALRRHRRERFHNHMSAREIRDALPTSVWRDYTKVSIVRNPFDRVISKYYWLRKTGALEMTFHDWLISTPSAVVENRNLTRIDGESAMDIMWRYEHLTEDLTALSSKLGFPENLADIMGGIHAKGGVRKKKAASSNMFAGFDARLVLTSILNHNESSELGYSVSKMTIVGSRVAALGEHYS